VPLALFLGLCAEPLSFYCLGVDLITAQAVGMFCKELVPGLVPAALTMVRRIMMNNPAANLLILPPVAAAADVRYLRCRCLLLSLVFRLLAAAACLLIMSAVAS
jgi:hypothetical protein